MRSVALADSNRDLVRRLVLGTLLLLVLFFLSPSLSVHSALDVALIAHWSFDEGSGSTANDSTGNGNTGTPVNGPAWGDGKLGKARVITSSLQMHPTTGLWDHVVAVRDVANGRMRLYIAGTQIVSSSNSGGSVSNSADLSIGSKDTLNDDFLNGSLDDVFIFGRALSPAEVLDLFNSGN